ncbi:MAG: monovalent cation:H+ antiporter-2, family [Actinomycetota bacterium]|nr:monovalent cation:H+ antiporter-2, family [Actinomycetota bacterium]
MASELLILGALFVVAYVFGRLGKLVGLPSIPIYMLVGLVASPHLNLFPHLAIQAADVNLVAIFGLIFLLFNLGLEFDQDEFFGNAKALLLSGGTRIVINFGVGLGFGFMVGWGGREALIIAGMTATSSSAIVTKLLIELKRLANAETPVILGIAVVEDVFIAFYLAIVAVVIGGQTNVGLIILQLVISFLFLAAMFALARWGGKAVSRLLGSRDDELFTILFFGLAVMFGGLGELLGVSDAIGAFLIGLVLGATRFRTRIEGFALPLRDVFGAFFFLNFGLALDPSTFGGVLVPVAGAVLMTIVVNVAGGWLIAWLTRLPLRYGLGIGLILQNRGEFALILATLASGAGLDPRLTPFAGLYVLVMSIIGPVLTLNSERITAGVFRRGSQAPAHIDPAAEEAFALLESATADQQPGDDRDDDSDASDDSLIGAQATRPRSPFASTGTDPDLDDLDADDPRIDDLLLDRTVQQAMEQSDEQRSGGQTQRTRDPEY